MLAQDRLIIDIINTGGDWYVNDIAKRLDISDRVAGKRLGLLVQRQHISSRLNRENHKLYYYTPIKTQAINSVEPPIKEPAKPRKEPVKLSHNDIKLVRKCYLERKRLLNKALKLADEASNLTIRKLADKFDVHYTTISNVINGKYKRYPKLLE